MSGVLQGLGLPSFLFFFLSLQRKRIMLSNSTPVMLRLADLEYQSALRNYLLATMSFFVFMPCEAGLATCRSEPSC